MRPLLKLWIFIGVAVVLVAIVAGVGFIPVTKVEPYDCVKTEQYTCTKVRQVPCTKTETYTYYEQVPYPANEEKDLTYHTWGFNAYESWWDYDIWLSYWLRNTDDRGGYFKITFKCSLDGVWYSKSQTKWISSGDYTEYEVEFSRNRGQTWDYEYPIVTPPTKTVTVIKYRSEKRTGVREVAGTCDEAYETTCWREVNATCYRSKTGSKTEWLLWEPWR